MGWVRLLPFPGGLLGGALLSVCVRLEAEGLITRTERPGANQYAAGEAPFALLEKGKHFIEYVKRGFDSADLSAS